MDWNSFDTLIRTHFEPLQYAAFFGILVLLAGVEPSWHLAVMTPNGAADGR